MAKESNTPKLTEKHAGGRPKEYTPERIAEIIGQLNKYINDTECPIIADFAYKHDIRRQTLYDFKEFSDALRKMIDKKESALLYNGLSGEYNSQIVKLALAQLGYTDKNETKHTGKVTLDYSKMTDEELQTILENEE